MAEKDLYRRYAIVSNTDLRDAVRRLGDNKTDRGEMAEWSMAVVLKTTEPGRVPGVRIPLSPPSASAR
jgi:hypothetical protein